MTVEGLQFNEDVRALFLELAGLPVSEREAYYLRHQIPASDRRELESLLSYDETRSDPMAEMIGAAAEQLMLSGSPASPGSRCGPYRLLCPLGEGGMGTVYLAERADGELEHQVAIKFLRSDAFLPFFRDRFLRERQILASLNHPGIARLLDAGHAGGHPYLVMEHVDGTRIDQYAATLDLRGVLALILKVAEAVSYAHRMLVIHRDLKPSNILVDAAGQPKLLDFGIAKFLDSPGETLTMDRIMTPEYASPEQHRGEAQSTSTDVYSLGAVLYRLLTGRSPQLPTATDRLIPKDVSAILSKAMREEPEQRYASADAFIEDIRSYLEHRPVRARRGNALYLARKFAYRAWLPMTGALLALSGLTGGLLVADRERAIAERRFQQVRQLSKQFLELDADLRSLPGATKARNHIVSASLQYLERLGAEARPAHLSVPWARDAELGLDIATNYLRVARVQGVPTNPNLGQFEQAQKSLAQADSFLPAALDSSVLSTRRSALLTAAEIAHDRMILAETAKHETEALAFASKATGSLATLLTMDSPTFEESASAARLYVNIALSYSNMHRLDQAVPIARRSVEILRTQPARRPGENQRQLSRALSVLANALRFSGDLDAALQSAQQARAIGESTADTRDSLRTLTLGAALWREGLILGERDNINMNRPNDAIPLLQRAFDLAEGLARRDANDSSSRFYVSMAGRELGDVLRDSDPARALATYDQARRRVQEIPGNAKARRDEVWLLAGSTYALRNLHRASEVSRIIQSAQAILSDLRRNGMAATELCEESDALSRALASYQAGTGQTSEAIRTYETVYKTFWASSPEPKSDLRHANSLSGILRNLRNLHHQAGHTAEAAAFHQQLLELWTGWSAKLPNNQFIDRQLIAARNIEL